MAHERDYLAGIAILAAALFLSALLGLYQEHTYRMYGKQWKEALFYGVGLFFVICIPQFTSLIDPCSTFSHSLSLHPFILTLSKHTTPILPLHLSLYYPFLDLQLPFSLPCSLKPQLLSRPPNTLTGMSFSFLPPCLPSLSTS